MPGYPGDQVCSPPELPPYLKNVHHLKPIRGVPNDDEVMKIHAVILVANKVVDVQGMGDPLLLARLSEHLFNVQMAKYRSKSLGAIFPETTTYTPPTLPVHVTVQLEPVTGVPSEQEIIKVQNAIRSYHQFANAPSIFDPRIDMELSQHLFDIQMAKYIQSARESQNCSYSCETSSLASEDTQQTFTGESGVSGNNAGSGASLAKPHESVQPTRDIDVQDALERYPAEQLNKLAERFNEVFGRLNQHLEESNRLAKESTQPVEKLGEVLRNINRVLVRIQHAIVRNHKGNTLNALGCLANEKGETPDMSRTTENRTYTDFAEDDNHSFSVVIDGVTQTSYIEDRWLGEFIRFYGIDYGFF
ncbi:unnamed protein product [Rhizoctonia solani]|uniref:Laminin domain protein n=1 Tax=Rhizoctonia solani TaxID=456999 RepID=A0A8H3BR62_9AGAM|nr:unnamed protein product [Rhizoctonia solani]